MGLAPIERFGGLPETAREAIMDEGILQHLLEGTLENGRVVKRIKTHLEGLEDGHFAIGCFGELDLLGSVDLNFIASVRHPVLPVSSTRPEQINGGRTFQLC